MLRTRSPLGPKTAFDLHVLGMPPTFILSQDQTLHDESLLRFRRSVLVETVCQSLRLAFLPLFGWQGAALSSSATVTSMPPLLAYVKSSPVFALVACVGRLACHPRRANKKPLVRREPREAVAWSAFGVVCRIPAAKPVSLSYLAWPRAAQASVLATEY